MSYVIALAGNPNCGKTTLFNELTGSKQHVGNWPGVTVDKKEGTYKKNKEISILDLPGTYSLSPYSAEEIIARDYIVKEKPDAVINIVDATSIERNLYLTLQIAETEIPMIVALNMMDEVAQRGDSIDYNKLSKSLGVPVVPITARSGKGLNELMEVAATVVKNKTVNKPIDVFDENIKNAVQEVKAVLKEEREEDKDWKALKIVEGDEIITATLSDSQKSVIEGIIKEAEKAADGDTEAKIADLRYQFIAKLVKQAVKKANKGYSETRSDKLDKILTNRILALPIFAVVMYILFACTFSENFLFIPGLPSPGIWLAGLVETAWGTLSGALEGFLVGAGASDWLLGLVIGGIMDGIGAVAGFLPLVLVLFLLLSFLEDSGYMARIAFVMDRIFRRFGLSGRSFIPLLMGFGCSVPALMASRTLESDKDRKITMMITPFMSCGAKLPIYAMFAVTLFADQNQTMIVFSIYMLGLIVAILSSFILNKFVFNGEASNFIMELPQYRLPTIKSVLIHAWEKVKGFAIKAGTIIFGSTILIWLLSNFNFGGMCDMEESFLASIGNAIKIIFAPLGFADWRASVGVVTGWIAKENIVATFGQLYAGINDEAAIEAISAGEQALPQISNVFTNVSAYSYMAFNLLCMPCFAAVGAIRREMGSIKWTLRAVGFQMLVAYIVALIINVVGNIIF
ncbi:ferrous iron transport protein B [Mobilisporobacter senegalensis]|uniref:Ferrous iron transport protein B n=1 Tax=Mobilisporobacter senegalensis TaxID=1329262 RepID=A0A3N1XRP4_9FIRM|nr:ferrous iron transport protein B [Mobilisporobacter senegalensis]ROR27467.1 ferrous iron transport protein B [Mobilisporobacter senegalensis]